MRVQVQVVAVNVSMVAAPVPGLQVPLHPHSCSSAIHCTIFGLKQIQSYHLLFSQSGML